MKQSAIIELLGDRPIAYHPILAKALGDVKVAVWLSQLLYWQGKGKYGDWTWKSADDFYDETALTRREQERIRAILCEKGVLEEQRAGPKGVLHYRILVDVLAGLMASFSSDSTIGASVPDSTIGEIRNGEIRQSVESEGLRFDDSVNLIPETTYAEITMKPESTRAAAKKTAASPTPPKPSPRRGRIADKPIPQASEAVKAYRELAYLWPNEPQKQAIDAAVHPETVPRWTECIEAWLLRGYAKTNVGGMLDWFRDGIPKWNGGGRSGGPKSNVEKSLEAGDEFLRMVRQQEANSGND